MGQRPDEVNRDNLGDNTVFNQETGTYGSTGAGETESAEDTTEIRAGIEETRAEMTETINAIQERLNPQHLKEQVKEQVLEQVQEAKTAVREATIGKAEDMVRHAGDTLNEARYGLMETIRQNPIPAALVGIGLGWLFMNRQSGASRRHVHNTYQDQYYRGGQPYYGAGSSYTAGGSSYGSGAYTYGYGAADQSQGGVRSTLHRAQATAGDVVDRAQETVGNIADRTQETVGNIAGRTQETVGNVVNQAQETASNIASQTQETMGYLADQAQYQAQRVEDRFQQTLYENPLAVGAVALALGTAVGFSLPQTQRENQLLGETRDTLVERAQEAAQHTLEKVQQVAGEVMDQAQTTVQQRTTE